MKTHSMGAKAVVFAAMIACVTAFGDLTSVQNERDIARSNEMRTRLHTEQLERINRLKDNFEIKADETMKLLSRISEKLESYSKQKESLLINDQGKRLVVDSKSFISFLYLYDNPTLTTEEIKSKLASGQSILKAIQDERKQVDVGYLPSPELFDELNILYAWAKDQFARLEGQQATLKTILDEAQELQDSNTVKILSKAIEEYRAQLPKLLAESKILGEHLAQEESKQIFVDAARLAKLEKAMAERDRMLEQMKMEITQLKLEQELELVKLKSQAAREHFEAEKRFQDTMAELERLRKDADIKRQVDDMQANITREQTLNNAKKQEQFAKLHTTEVQNLMIYFTTKGYWQPGKRGASYEHSPVSYSQLQAYGALVQNADGLSKLLTAMNSYHNDRPQFCQRGKNLKGLSNEEHQKLVTIQKFLIELGPLMVEEKMLAP